MVRGKGKVGKRRTLHRNMLLPVNFLPLPEEVPLSQRRIKNQKEDQKTPDTSVIAFSEDDTSDSDEESDTDQDHYMYRTRSRNLGTTVDQPCQQPLEDIRESCVAETESSHNEEAIAIEAERAMPTPAMAQRPTRNRKKPKALEGFVLQGQLESILSKFNEGFVGICQSFGN